MINIFLEIIALIKYQLIGLFFLLAILSFYWLRLFNFFKLKSNKKNHHIHKDEISRLGGFFIYLFFWFLQITGFIKDDFIISILLSSTPLILVSLKEDFFNNTTPKLRLFSMVISAVIFFYIYPIQFPSIDIPYLGNFNLIVPIATIFYIFSIIILINGMNLIDGMNGLFGFSAISIFFGLSSLAVSVGDIQILKLCLLFVIPIIIFLFFNFPFGKIFMGDLGVYFYGYVTALSVIFFFGKHQNLSSFLAVLILFYPCMELAFSFARKILNKQNPLDADKNHLHTLIQRFLIKKTDNYILSNYLTSLFLVLFWITPITSCIFFEYKSNSIFFYIAFLSSIYIFAYKILHSNK